MNERATTARSAAARTKPPSEWADRSNWEFLFAAIAFIDCICLFDTRIENQVIKSPSVDEDNEKNPHLGY
jgi:hypothetical protein